MTFCIVSDRFHLHSLTEQVHSKVLMEYFRGESGVKNSLESCVDSKVPVTHNVQETRSAGYSQRVSKRGAS